MPFWKKSEDPWDIDPEKQRRPVPQPEDGHADPDTGLLEDLRAWNQARKEKKARREAPPEPIPCPWCGKEMEPGYLIGGRDAVRLVRQRPGALRIVDPDDTLYIRGDGTFWRDYKIAWTCQECRKLVLDLPEPPPPSYWDTVPQENAANEREEEH